MTRDMKRITHCGSDKPSAVGGRSALLTFRPVGGRDVTLLTTALLRRL